MLLAMGRETLKAKVIERRHRLLRHGKCYWDKARVTGRQ
jgi:hypothetical protein